MLAMDGLAAGFEKLAAKHGWHTHKQTLFGSFRQGFCS